MKDRAKNDKIKSSQQNLSKGSPISHEQYNTRNAVSSSPNEICGEIRSETYKPKIQQMQVIHIFLENPMKWQCGSLADKSKRPHHHPNEQMTHPGERIQVDVKFVPIKCLANKEQKLYQYTAIDEFTRLRFVYGYEEHSTYSSSDFLKSAVAWYKRHGIKVECVQTDNGCEFTTRFIQGLKDKPTIDLLGN